MRQLRFEYLHLCKGVAYVLEIPLLLCLPSFSLFLSLSVRIPLPTLRVHQRSTTSTEASSTMSSSSSVLLRRSRASSICTQRFSELAAVLLRR